MIKSNNDKSDEGYFFEADVYYLKIHMTFTMTYHFYLKE